MFSALSRIVPPPKYLTMPAVGVDISDTSLKYIALKQNLKPDTEQLLLDWGEVSIPSGVVSRGQVGKPKQLVAVLAEFKEQTGAEFVRVSLPEERAYMFETEVNQNMPAKEVRGLLEFRLEENVPIPSKDVFFDYVFLPGKRSRTVDVAVAAYAKETIQTYYDACVMAGLYPVAF